MTRPIVLGQSKRGVEEVLLPLLILVRVIHTLPFTPSYLQILLLKVVVDWVRQVKFWI